MPNVNVRLREGKDDDIEEAMLMIPKSLDKADIVREALRSYFFNAPTPLKDNLEYFNQTLSKPKALPSVKHEEIRVEKLPDKPKPIKLDPITPTTVPVSSDLEDKLNRSLGF